MLSALRRPLLALVVATSACRCGGETTDDAATEALAVAPQSDAPIVAEPPAQTPVRVVVHEASELAGLDLTATRELDLALSDVDRLGRMDELDPAAACTGLDMRDVARRAPQLRRLRISGCVVALAEASALASTLEELTIADVAVDATMLAHLAAFSALHTLVLTRVTTPAEWSSRPSGPESAIAPLSALGLRRVALHELDRDSPLADILALWPKTLKEVSLVGAWAGHDAMQTLSKAAALEVLELRDTRVGNFSLNQIKPLSHLRELHWAGDTFNDNSPLYFRELDVQTLVCDCPRFGDGGLQTLRHCESVKHLELAHSRVSDAGLAALVRLPKLESLVLHERDVGEAGFIALAAVPTLRRLELSGDTMTPALPHLGDLRALEVLVLGYPSVDDRAATELAKLTALRRLVLAGTKISDVGLTAIAGMTELRELSLSRTRITNRGLVHVARATKLEELELDHTDLVDAALVHLAGLHALARLRIDHTLVTDAGLVHLHALRALRSLDVTGTVVSEAGLVELRSALPELVDVAQAP